MPRQFGTTPSGAWRNTTKVKLYSIAWHISPAMTTNVQPVSSRNCRRDSLQQRRARSRALMLYRVCNGLVAIPASVCLHSTVVHSRGFETSYRQIQCNTSMYKPSFLVQSHYGTPRQLMSASCRLTALRLNSTPSS